MIPVNPTRGCHQFIGKLLAWLFSYPYGERCWQRLGSLKSSILFGSVLVFCMGTISMAEQIKYGVVEDANDQKTLLLRDYRPKPMLHAEIHLVQHPKFPVIDVHNHVNDAMGIDSEGLPPGKVVEIMDHCGIRTICILTGMWGDQLQHVVDRMVKPYPGRFMVFTQLDWSKVNDPNFSQLMIRQIRESVSQGARGLKVLKDLGLEIRDESGKLLPVDAQRLHPIWAACGRIGIPVAIHSGTRKLSFSR